MVSRNGPFRLTIFGLSADHFFHKPEIVHTPMWPAILELYDMADYARQWKVAAPVPASSLTKLPP